MDVPQARFMADATTNGTGGVPLWLKPGLRKVSMLGGPMVGLLLTGIIALFVGKMTAPEFSSYSLEILRWGGGIFALGNVIEHGAKMLEKRGSR